MSLDGFGWFRYRHFRSIDSIDAPRHLRPPLLLRVLARLPGGLLLLLRVTIIRLGQRILLTLIL
jgi:hypothetical protein